MPTDELITATEAATLCGVSRWTIYAWFNKGDIQGRQYPSGTIRIVRSSVEHLIDESTPRQRTLF